MPANIGLTTLPETVKNLRLDNALSNSLLVKWDPISTAAGTQSKIKLSIESCAFEGEDWEYKFSTDLTDDKTTFLFSKIPEPEVVFLDFIKKYFLLN